MRSIYDDGSFSDARYRRGVFSRMGNAAGSVYDTASQIPIVDDAKNVGITRAMKGPLETYFAKQLLNKGREFVGTVRNKMSNNDSGFSDDNFTNLKDGEELEIEDTPGGQGSGRGPGRPRKRIVKKISSAKKKDTSVTIENLQKDQEVTVTSKNKYGKNKKINLKEKNSNKNISNAASYSEFSSSGRGRMVGHSGSLGKSDHEFISLLSKSINSKLTGDSSKTLEARLYNSVNSLQSGLGKTVIAAFPRIGILKSAEYYSQLPNPKKVGVLSALNTTTGMIYSAMRGQLSETNRLLYALINVTKTGLMVDTKVKPPEDLAQSFSEGIGKILRKGVDTVVGAPFKFGYSAMKSAFGFGNRPDEDNMYGPGLMNAMRGMGGGGYGGGGRGGSRNNRPFIHTRQKSIRESIGSIPMGRGRTIGSNLNLAKNVGLGALGTSAMLNYLPGILSSTGGLIGSGLGALGTTAGGVASAGGSLAMSGLGSLAMSPVGLGAMGLIGAGAGAYGIHKLLRSRFARRNKYTKGIARSYGRGYARLSALKNKFTNFNRTRVGELPEGVSEDFGNESGGMGGGGGVDLSQIIQLLTEIRDCVCNENNGGETSTLNYGPATPNGGGCATCGQNPQVVAQSSGSGPSTALATTQSVGVSASSPSSRKVPWVPATAAIAGGLMGGPLGLIAGGISGMMAQKAVKKYGPTIRQIFSTLGTEYNEFELGSTIDMPRESNNTNIADLLNNQGIVSATVTQHGVTKPLVQLLDYMRDLVGTQEEHNDLANDVNRWTKLRRLFDMTMIPQLLGSLKDLFVDVAGDIVGGIVSGMSSLILPALGLLGLGRIPGLRKFKLNRAKAKRMAAKGRRAATRGGGAPPPIPGGGGGWKGKVVSGATALALGGEAYNYMNGEVEDPYDPNYDPDERGAMDVGLATLNSQLTKSMVKSGTKYAAGKIGMKTLFKSGSKKIPILGAIAGSIYAAQRAMAGDYAGAAAEIASGVAGSLGPLGTGASIAIDAGLAANDIRKEKAAYEEANGGVINTVKNTANSVIENTPKSIEEAKALADKAKEKASAFYEENKDKIPTDMEGIKETWKGITDFSNDVAIPKAKESWQQISDFTKDVAIPEATKSWKSISEYVTKELIPNSKNRYASVTSRDFDQDVDDSKQYASNMFSSITNQSTELFNSLKQNTMENYNVENGIINNIAGEDNRVRTTLSFLENIKELLKNGLVGLMFGDRSFERIMTNILNDPNSKTLAGIGVGKTAADNPSGTSSVEEAKKAEEQRKQNYANQQANRNSRNRNRNKKGKNSPTSTGGGSSGGGGGGGSWGGEGAGTGSTASNPKPFRHKFHPDGRIKQDNELTAAERAEYINSGVTYDPRTDQEIEEDEARHAQLIENDDWINDPNTTKKTWIDDQGREHTRYELDRSGNYIDDQGRIIRRNKSQGIGSTSSSGISGVSSGGSFNSVKEMIKRHEGLVLNRYNDSRGFPTIGYGHLIKPEEMNSLYSITKEQAEELFEQDFNKHATEASSLPGFDQLDPVRQGALIDMTFNMGKGGVLKFKNMLNALKEGDYTKASAEILDSAYASQTGRRAQTIAHIIETGNMPGSGGGSKDFSSSPPVQTAQAAASSATESVSSTDPNAPIPGSDGGSKGPITTAGATASEVTESVSSKDTSTSGAIPGSGGGSKDFSPKPIEQVPNDLSTEAMASNAVKPEQDMAEVNRASTNAGLEKSMGKVSDTITNVVTPINNTIVNNSKSNSSSSSVSNKSGGNGNNNKSALMAFMSENNELLNVLLGVEV